MAPIIAQGQGIQGLKLYMYTSNINIFSRSTVVQLSHNLCEDNNYTFIGENKELPITVLGVPPMAPREEGGGGKFIFPCLYETHCWILIKLRRNSSIGQNLYIHSTYHGSYWHDWGSGLRLPVKFHTSSLDCVISIQVFADNY